MEFEPLALTAALLIGMVLGLFFFGTLWLTVRHVPRSRHPIAVVFGSLLGRMAVVLGAFYFLMDGGWQRPVACLVGFVVVRQVMIRVVGIQKLGETTRHGRPSA